VAARDAPLPKPSDAGGGVKGKVGTTARVVLGLVVSAVCLWLAVQRAPIAELMAAPSQINYGLVMVAVAMTVVSFAARGCRWRTLLADRGTRMEYFWAQCVGSLLTNVFPLRAGEAGRVVIISRRIGLPLVQVGASLVVERILDLSVILGLLAALLLIMDVPWAVTATGLGLGAALVVVAFGMLVLLTFGERLTGLVELIAVRLPARLAQLVRDTWVHLLGSVEPLRDVWVVGKVVGWSLLIWTSSIVSFWACIEAVVPGGSLLEASFALTAVALGVALPSSPGFIGVFHFIGQQALEAPFPHRYTAASAFIIALLNHAAYYVPSSLLGMLGLARLGLSLRSVRGAADEPTPALKSVSGAPVS
jgi:uncharacterized membrane protein YbhN (UPF0104 family)